MELEFIQVNLEGRSGTCDHFSPFTTLLLARIFSRVRNNPKVITYGPYRQIYPRKAIIARKIHQRR